MRGRNQKIKCPYCKFEYIKNFGITSYYYVKQLDDEYTICSCPSCNKSFWHNSRQSIEKYDDDEAVFCGNACY